MTRLRLSSDLALPADLATHVTLIAGKRGSGKTNTAKRLVEQLHHARVPFGVLDPVDVWWGIKAGKGGTREGGLEDVYVFGGKHADYPLASTGGSLMADLFVDYRISAVMEMREWSGADRARFVTAFAHRLLERNTEPFVLVAEEAHDLMPQQAMGEEKGSLGAMLRLVKLGRSGGIGLLELTQRLAALNKTATTQADVLVMHRTTGPQDRKALNDWIAEHHASDEERNAFLRALPELKTGEAFVWAPDFPEDKPIGLVRARILECETFNSHATPKIGEKRVEPKELTKVDLDRLAKAMSATIEKAKADDPRELKARIRELEAAVKKGANDSRNIPAPTPPQILEVAVLKNGALKKLQGLTKNLVIVSGRVLAASEQLRGFGGDLAAALEPVDRELARITSTPSALPLSLGSVDGSAVRAGVPRATFESAARVNVRSESASAPRTTDGISNPQQRMLDALAWLESIGAPGAKWSVLAFLSGQSPKSSGFEKNVSVLRSTGYIVGNGKTVGFELTQTGHPIANQPASPATSEQLHQAIFAKISTPQERMLRALIASYPRNLTWDELAEKGEQSPMSSGFEKNVSTLRSYGLIEGRRGTGYVAQPHLFLEAANR